MVPFKSWDEIKLPDDVGNQPAELNLNETEGDPGVVADPKPAEPAAGAAPAGPDPKPAGEPAPAENKVDEVKTEAPADPAKPEIKPNEVPAGTQPEEKKVEAPAAGPAPDQASDPLKDGFHKHPDWQKMEQEKREAELKAAKLEGRIEAMEKAQEANPAEIKTARQRINELVESGKFKPESQLDLLTKYDELKEEEKKERTALAETKLTEAKQRITTSLNTTYSELGISEAKDRQVIEDQVEAWRKEGIINVSIDNLPQVIKHSYQTLKDKGLIGKAVSNPTPAPSTDPAAIAVAKKAAEERAMVNGSINKPAGSDGGGQAPQRTFKSYDQLHNEDMDTRAAKAATRLG